MYSKEYVDYYNKNLWHKTYLKNDALLTCVPGSFNLNGFEDKMINLIMKEQLLKPELWELFANQFKIGNVDDANYGWKGEFWGKMMRGACITYKYCRSPELYSILENTVNEILSAQDSAGRISTYSAGNEFNGWDMWSRKYVMLGLLHFYEICKSDFLRERIILSLKLQLNYIINRIGEGENKIPIGKTSELWCGANSLSILEPVVGIYNLTGEKQYLDFAEYLVKSGPDGEDNNFFDIAYAGKIPPYKWKVRKAYEVISCFEGAIEYYRASGDEKYKRAAINFAELLINTDVTVIGCCGCEEELFDHSAATQTDTTNRLYMQETCVTVTWIKFCFQLLRLTGDSRYADEIEKSVYNALYGAVNTEKSRNNHGLPFDSYSPLLMNKRGREVGGQQYLPDGTLLYGCCAAIGSAGIGIVPELCMQESKKGIAVSLYVNGEYSLKSPMNGDIRLRVDTKYPADGNVKITVEHAPDEEFEIAARVPKFAIGTTVYINGAQICAEAGKYCVMKRKWTKGDEIAISVDMAPRVLHPIGCEKDKNSKKFVTVKYGPLVLVRDSRICPDIGQKVRLNFDCNDRIALERGSAVPFDVLCEFKAPTADGGFTRLIDYQSAGKTWDENSLTEAWLPV